MVVEIEAVEHALTLGGNLGEYINPVESAEAAGNKAGRGGSYLRSLYRRAWSRIDRIYVPLGPSPF